MYMVENKKFLTIIRPLFEFLKKKKKSELSFLIK